MIRRLFLAATAGGAAWLGVKLWPDVQRYIRIKRM